METRSRGTAVAETVTVAVPIIIAPLTGAVAVAVMVAVPGLTPVARPAAVIVAMVVSLELQATGGTVVVVSSTAVGGALKFPTAAN